MTVARGSRRLVPPVVLAAAVLSGAGGCRSTGPTYPDDRRAIDRLLDDFHAAAATGDGDRYFGCFVPDGIFVGTDASERWTVDEFRAYAEPLFEDGAGWTYEPRSRQVVIDRVVDAAWFHELLHNSKYGECRGTGTLVRIDDEWRIAQYTLTFPVPNEVALDVIRITQRRDREASDE